MLWLTVVNAYYSADASDLQDFLRSCNPRQQLSVTFESYLIKPIQRILKYPLLLRQLMDLTEAYTDEHRHLAGDIIFHVINAPLRPASVALLVALQYALPGYGYWRVWVLGLALPDHCVRL